MQKNAAWMVLQATRRTEAEPLYMTAGEAEDHLQDGSDYIQGPSHLNTRLPRLPLYRVQTRGCVRNLRSSDSPLLFQPFTRTDFAKLLRTCHLELTSQDSTGKSFSNSLQIQT